MHAKAPNLAKSIKIDNEKYTHNINKFSVHTIETIIQQIKMDLLSRNIFLYLRSIYKENI